MLLVTESYGENLQLVVSEDMVKHGFDFGDQDNLLTDAGEDVFNKYLEERDNENEGLTFWEFLDNLGIQYKTFSNEHYYDYDDIEKDTQTYKYFYNSFENELVAASDLLSYEECYFLEYWDGHNNKQIELEDGGINLEKIESDLEGFKEHKTYQYDLYKDDKGTLYLNLNSYYQGELGSAEEVTEEELKERFNYDVISA